MISEGTDVQVFVLDLLRCTWLIYVDALRLLRMTLTELHCGYSLFKLEHAIHFQMVLCKKSHRLTIIY